MVSNDERARLEQVRELIMQKQFAEARAILRGLTHTSTGQRWLEKLDEIAPETLEAKPAEPVNGVPDWAVSAAKSPSQQQTVNIAFNLDVRTVRYIVAGVVAIMAVLMIAGFALLPWMDMSDINFMGISLDAFGDDLDIDKGPLEITALEIWTGRNSGENFTLDLTIEDGQGDGISDVRTLDRFLIVLPFLGLVLLWLAWMYAFPAGDGLSPLVAAALMAFVALLLLLFPFMWEDMSTSAMEDDLKSTMSIDMDGADDFDFDFGGLFDMDMFTGIFTEAYSTGEQKLMGALALLAALAGLAAEVVNGRPAPAPRPSVPVS